MSRYNLDNLFVQAEKVTADIAANVGNNGGFSVGIVNSNQNGRRISLSKALCAKLQITDTAVFMPLPQEGVLLVANELPMSNAVKGNLKGEGKKLCYSAELVLALSKLFNLDFSTRTSMSFSDVEIDVKDDIPVAIVAITNPA